MPEQRGGRPIAASQRPTGGDKAIATGKKQYFRRKKVCRFCVDKVDDINYKDVEAARQLHLRARQDHAAPHFRRLHAAPEASERSDQAGAQYRAAALRFARCRGQEENHGSHSQRRCRKVGARGAVVKVADGYARNFLLPKRLAVPATDSNKKIVEQEREAHLRREAKPKSEAEDLAKLMANVTLTFRQRVGENNQLFGSVTAKDIADALEAQKFHIERRKVQLDEPIRTLGEHKVTLRLHRDVTTEINVVVEPEQ